MSISMLQASWHSSLTPFSVQHAVGRNFSLVIRYSYKKFAEIIPEIEFVCKI